MGWNSIMQYIKIQAANKTFHFTFFVAKILLLLNKKKFNAHFKDYEADSALIILVWRKVWHI
jgi:hypothetical protein